MIETVAMIEIESVEDAIDTMTSGGIVTETESTTEGIDGMTGPGKERVAIGMISTVAGVETATPTAVAQVAAGSQRSTAYMMARYRILWTLVASLS